jgi:hypothetical protein
MEMVFKSFILILKRRGRFSIIPTPRIFFSKLTFFFPEWNSGLITPSYYHESSNAGVDCVEPVHDAEFE